MDDLISRQALLDDIKAAKEHGGMGAGFADTVLGVVSAPGQFAGYDPENPVTDEFAAMAREILVAHWRESQGERDVGRVLPKEFLYFASRGDGRNYFRTEYRGGTFWEGV